MDTSNRSKSVDAPDENTRNRNIFDRINTQAIQMQNESEINKRSNVKKKVKTAKLIETDKENSTDEVTASHEKNETDENPDLAGSKKILPRVATHPRDITDDDDDDEPVIKCLFNDGKYHCVNCDFRITYPCSFQYHIWKHLHLIDKTCNLCEGEELEINPFKIVCPIVLLVMTKLKSRARKYDRKMRKEKQRLTQQENQKPTSPETTTVSASDQSNNIPESVVLSEKDCNSKRKIVEHQELASQDTPNPEFAAETEKSNTKNPLETQNTEESNRASTGPVESNSPDCSTVMKSNHSPQTYRKIVPASGLVQPIVLASAMPAALPHIMLPQVVGMSQVVSATNATLIAAPSLTLQPTGAVSSTGVDPNRSVWRALVPAPTCVSPPKPSSTMSPPVGGIKKECTSGTDSPGMNIVVHSVTSLADVQGASALFDSPSKHSSATFVGAAKEIASAVKPIKAHPPDPAQVQAAHLERLEKSEDAQFYVCGVGRCTYATIMEGAFDGHLFTRHSFERELPCVYCQSTFPTKEHLIEHMKIHGNVVEDVKPYSCNECDFSSNTCADLQRHYSSHKVERHVCKHCRETFTEADDLWRHLSKNIVKIVRCAHCRVMNSNRRLVLKHLTAQHPGQPKSFNLFIVMLCKEKRRVATCLSDKCSGCGERVPDLSLLRKHLETCERYTSGTASGNSRVECIDCTASFKNQLELVRHVLRGHALSFLTCPVNDCDFATSHPTKYHTHCLQLHKTLEDRVTIYVCSACNVKSNLKDFVRVHVTKKHDESSGARICSKEEVHSDYKESANYWQCKKCRMFFPKKNQKAIADHRKEHNSSPEGVEKCQKCGKTFDCLVNLYEHIETSHSGRADLTLYTCLVCPFRSTNEDATLAHSKGHRKSITTCDKLEKTLSNTTVSCPVCTFCCVEREIERVLVPHIEEKHTDLSDKLKNRVRGQVVHQDEQPGEPIAPHELQFPCQHCQFSGTVDAYRSHIVKHFTGERTFTWFNCAFCDFQARSGALVTRHCKTTHLISSNCVDRRTVTLIGTGAGVDGVDISQPVSPPKAGSTIERYQCDHCSLGFADDESFRKHVCPVAESSDVKLMAKHELNATRSEPVDLPDLDIPILSPHGRQPVDDDDDDHDMGDAAAPEEDTETASETEIPAPMSDDSPFQCPHCEYSTKAQRGLKIHITVMHKNGYGVAKSQKPEPAYKRGSTVPNNRKSLMKTLKGPASVMRHAKLAAKKPESPNKAAHVGRNVARKSTGSSTNTDNTTQPAATPAEEEVTVEEALSPFPHTFYRRMANALYECRLCSNFTETWRPLFAHLVQTHLNMPRYCCSKCDFKKHQQSEVADHCEREHGDRHVFLNKNFMSTDRSELTERVKDFCADTGRDKSYSPLKATSSRDRREDVFQHPVTSESRKTETKRYKCKLCSAPLHGDTQAKDHVRKMHQGKLEDVVEITSKCAISLIHRCIHCDEYQSSRSPMDVIEHYGLRHKGLSSYVCDHCKSRFSKLLDLVHHTKTDHANAFVEITRTNTNVDNKHPIKIAEEFKCPECSFRRSSSYLVREHIKTHTFKQDAVFQCFYCKFASDKKTAIAEHHKGLHGSEMVAMIIDKGVVKRKRDVSPETSSANKKPRLEIATPPKIAEAANDSSPAYGRRSGSEKLVCPKCEGKKFETTELKDMRKHIMNHMEYMPFRCKFSGCKHKALSEHAILKHFRTAHKGEPKYDSDRRESQEKLLKKLLMRAKTGTVSSSSDSATPERRKTASETERGEKDSVMAQNRDDKSSDKRKVHRGGSSTPPKRARSSSGHSSSRSEAASPPVSDSSTNTATKSYLWQNNTTVTYLCLICDYKIDGNYNLIEKHFANKHSGRVQALAINKENRHKYEPKFGKRDGRLTLTCRVCSFQAHQHTEFRKHWREHLVMNWKCGYCGSYEAADKQEILYHARTDHPGVPSNVLKMENARAVPEEKPDVKPILWSKDGEKVETSNNGIPHKSKPDGQFGCTKCTFSSADLKLLEDHFIKWHKPRYQCEDCSYRVRCIDDMKKHLSSNKNHGYVEIDDETLQPLPDTVRRGLSAVKERTDADYRKTGAASGSPTAAAAAAAAAAAGGGGGPSGPGKSSPKKTSETTSSSKDAAKEIRRPRELAKVKPKETDKAAVNRTKQSKLKLKKKTRPASDSSDTNQVVVGPSEAVKSRSRKSRATKFVESDDDSENVDDDRDEDFRPVAAMKKKWGRVVSDSSDTDEESDRRRSKTKEKEAKKKVVAPKVGIKTEPRSFSTCSTSTSGSSTATRDAESVSLPRFEACEIESSPQTATIVEEGLSYRCHYCPERLDNELEFGLHMNRHIKFNRTVTAKPIDAQDRGLSTAKLLYKQHVHPYFCCKCGKSFFNLNCAKSHATTAHRGPSKVNQLGFSGGKPCDEIIGIIFEEFAAEESLIDKNPRPLEASDQEMSVNFFPSPLDGLQPNVLLEDFRNLPEQKQKSLLSSSGVKNAVLNR